MIFQFIKCKKEENHFIMKAIQRSVKTIKSDNII